MAKISWLEYVNFPGDRMKRLDNSGQRILQLLCFSSVTPQILWFPRAVHTHTHTRTQTTPTYLQCVICLHRIVELTFSGVIEKWCWLSYCFVQSLCHVWLCNTMDYSTQGFPVLHHLPKFAQIHAHWVGDAIQPSHPLLYPSPPAFNLSQHQGLF